MILLALNPGSSTLKYRLIRQTAAEEETLARGVIELNHAEGQESRGAAPERADVSPAGKEASLCPAGSVPLHDDASIPMEAAMEGAMKEVLARCHAWTIEAIGYRVVHGGAKYTQPTRVTPDLLRQIHALDELAPLHNPLALAAIAVGFRLLPDVPAVAAFDTAFHRTLPPAAYYYALPLEMSDRLGLRRYGFHGLSHRYVSETLLQCLGRPPEGTRLITCHLGNGASVCAVRDGRSVDTSMGMTPLEGLVMGTRCGDIDPGLILHLLRTEGMSVEQVDDLLERRSGLRGLSERSGDVRDLEAAARAGDARAELALQTFAYRVRKYIGAYTAALGGLDGLAFAGGIGEHSAWMRTRICGDLGFLGLVLDPARNEAAGSEPARVSTDESRIPVWVIPTDEERQIVRETWALLNAPA